MAEEKKRFITTLTKDTHAWLFKRAKENNRSANAELQQIIKEAREKEEQEK